MLIISNIAQKYSTWQLIENKFYVKQGEKFMPAKNEKSSIKKIMWIRTGDRPVLL